MIYYNSRYLSQKLEINLAKWKRWVREFLPPDPLGGMQSGVTRQFNAKDAFKVYLGGYLVANLKLTIPDASTILSDLSPWLKEKGFFQIHARPSLNQTGQMPSYQLFIHPYPDHRFVYEVRTAISSVGTGKFKQQKQESCSLIQTGDSTADYGQFDPMCGFMIALTSLYSDFLQKIVSEKEPALHRSA